MQRLIFTFALAALLPLQGIADSPAPRIPLVFTSAYASNVFFTMVPTEDETRPLDDQPGRGAAYRLNQDGTLKELYKTSGWYSFRVFVSRTGRYLVRMGPWNSGHEPAKGDLAVAFYKDGKLLKSYSTAALVKNPRKVRVTASHYSWEGKTAELSAEDKFTLSTIDGWEYVFDVTTGRIVSETREKE